MFPLDRVHPDPVMRSLGLSHEPSDREKGDLCSRPLVLLLLVADQHVKEPIAIALLLQDLHAGDRTVVG